MYGQLQFLLSADTFGFLWNYIDFVFFCAIPRLSTTFKL
jgi:hypothetical protein